MPKPKVHSRAVLERSLLNRHHGLLGQLAAKSTGYVYVPPEYSLPMLAAMARKRRVSAALRAIEQTLEVLEAVDAPLPHLTEVCASATRARLELQRLALALKDELSARAKALVAAELEKDVGTDAGSSDEPKP